MEILIILWLAINIFASTLTVAHYLSSVVHGDDDSNEQYLKFRKFLAIALSISWACYIVLL